MKSKMSDATKPRPRDIDLNPQPFIQSRRRRVIPQPEVHRFPQIERTLSWEWKEAQQERPSREDLCNGLPEVVTLSTTYFGKLDSIKPRRFLKTSQPKPSHEKPFYPAGVARSSIGEANKMRVAFARSAYQSPKMRQVMRSRTLSEPCRTPIPQFNNLKQHIFRRSSFPSVRLSFRFLFLSETRLIHLLWLTLRGHR